MATHSTALSLVFLATCGTLCAAQSNFDLEPPMQASTNSAQVTMSPDPDALPVFKFATAELDDDGNITIATKKVKQQLVAPRQATVAAELDPSGIRYTENVTQTYTVTVPYTETDDDGNNIQKFRTETRTRTVPVMRYRKRNAEEQAKFEKKVAAHEAKMKEEDKTKVAPAKATQVQQSYQVNVPYTENVDGEEIARTRSEMRTRTVTVYRGKTNTTAKIQSKAYPLKEVKCFGIDGSQLDEDTIKKRLSERQPVILINSEQGITPFFESLLNPEAIFVVTPKQ